MHCLFPKILNIGALILLVFLLRPSVEGVEEKILDKRLHHLRSGGQREWSEFPERAEGARLDLEFAAAANGVEHTLRLRQRDVKQPWRLLINNKELGRLSQDENDRISIWPVPAGLLAAGLNRLEIVPGSDRADDILAGDIRLYDQTVAEVIGGASAEITVVDAASGQPIPCRLTVVDSSGSLLPLKASPSNRLAITTGMIYTADGSATFQLPAGQHTVYAGRGFEYSVATAKVSFNPGETSRRELKIHREVPT